MDEMLGLESKKFWVQYGELMREGLREGFRETYGIWNDRYETYARFGVVMAGFSADQGGRLLQALENSLPAPVANDGAIPQFQSTEFPDAEIAAINKNTEFLKPSARAMWWLSEIIDDLAQPVASFMGSPWRVLCVRAWRMRAGSENEGANSWHTDRLPYPIVKIMIYPHAIDRKQGTTEARFPDGQTLAFELDGPCWVLLKSSEVEHRGVPPLLDGISRYAVELTIVPSPRFDLVPTFAGNNVRQPVYPWLRSSYFGL